jgi:hypothetical protein
MNSKSAGIVGGIFNLEISSLRFSSENFRPGNAKRIPSILIMLLSIDEEIFVQLLVSCLSSCEFILLLLSSL